ncbi:hypothetical protein SAMN05414139_04523 [Burkholderia sp. D7]|nr:hypothetical protein SAMN05414139_04523 [Burkholderia sp. D7]
MMPENVEDVSFGYVPGSIGSAGDLVVPWAPRRTPASDRARALQMEAIRRILPKIEPHREPSKPIDSEAYCEAVAPFKRRSRMRGRG